jgi:septal ring factor EnvC (AmiA/AmiB activator)
MTDVKQAKVIATPLTPTVPTMIPRVPSGTPSPRPASIERKVAEQRKKLEALGQKRLETAKKQEELDKQMAPYKQRLAEELERLNREMMEEEAAAAEDEEHLKASAEMCTKSSRVQVDGTNGLFWCSGAGTASKSG